MLRQRPDGLWENVGKDPDPPSPKAPRTSPSAQDRKFAANPKVSRISQGEFYVSEIVDQPVVKHTMHLVSPDCLYCHKTIHIHVHAPINAAKFITDEACRIGMLEHLRIARTGYRPITGPRPLSPDEPLSIG